MEKTIEDLRLEADELGIQYPKNTGAAKLQTKIDEFYDAESEDSIVEQIAEVDGEDTVAVDGKKTKAQARIEALQVIKAQERKNSKAVVIKLTIVDKRESSTATDAYLGNGDFGMKVPLDTWVEVPSILAALAEQKEVPVHKVIDGKSSVVMGKQYVVEHKDK